MIGSVRTAILARVSTDDQFAENQIPPCLALADRLGLPVPEVLPLETVSGTKNSDRDRPSLARASDLATAGRLQALIVWALDRIGRNMWDVIDRFRAFEAAGCRVYSVSEAWTYECPEEFRPLMLSQTAWWAGMERRRLVGRTKIGIARARRDGKQIGRLKKISPQLAQWAWECATIHGMSWAKISAYSGEKHNRTSLSTAVNRWARETGRIGKNETIKSWRVANPPAVRT